MIRLIDCEVFSADKTDITRGKLFTFFLNGHIKDLMVVYSDGLYEGVISYKKLLNTSSESVDDIIEKRKYICEQDDYNLFANLKEMFKNAEDSLITLMDKDGQILYFAYDDDTSAYYDIELVMKELENNKSEEEIFDEGVFEGAAMVRMQDLNEYAFRFYNILKIRKIPVEVHGEAWGVLFPKMCEKYQNIPNSNVFKIYADGVSRTGLSESSDVRNQWIFISEIGQRKHNKLTEIYRKKFEKKGIKCLTAYFPHRAGGYNTIEELYREKRICIDMPKWNGAHVKEQIESVYGRKIDETEWKKLATERNKDARYVYDIESKICFGTAKNKVYMIGPCIVQGATAASLDESLGGCLNGEIRRLSDEYAVEGRACGLYSFAEYEKILKSLTVTENDIIILIDRLNSWNKQNVTKDVLIDDILAQRKCDWFYDMPLHTNYVGNREISRSVCRDYLAQMIKNPKKKPQYLQAGQLKLEKDAEQTLNAYIEQIRSKIAKDGMKIGSIVMNCNPMTNGHLYLIDAARKMVDLLYIFIVEEDKSDFKFRDRLTLVKNETSQMENVAVVPSGKYVLSFMTMPLYFNKQEKRQALLDASNDLRLFGNYIAPELGITMRFVGEEPIDMVTRQYNEAMKNMLPMYGVSVTEIPRLQQDGKIVSASMVRDYLKEGNMEQIKNIVPQGVYEYLCKNADSYRK